MLTHFILIGIVFEDLKSRRNFLVGNNSKKVFKDHVEYKINKI